MQSEMCYTGLSISVSSSLVPPSSVFYFNPPLEVKDH